MTSDLDDTLETRSFLVPAYEFEKGSEAVNFDPERRTAIGPLKGPDDAYAIIHRDERHFYPRATRDFLFNASVLFNQSVGFSRRPFYIRMQETIEEKPRGVSSTCLMAGGRRLSLYREGEKSWLVPSFAVWRTPRGEEPPWVSRVCYTHSDGKSIMAANLTICAHWSGHGALRAVDPVGLTHILLIDFHVYDNDPNRPDLLKITASRHASAAGEMPACDPSGAPLGDSWKWLIDEAERGYLEECGP